jgi:hypothetical protein
MIRVLSVEKADPNLIVNIERSFAGRWLRRTEEYRGRNLSWVNTQNGKIASDSVASFLFNVYLEHAHSGDVVPMKKGPQ